MPKPGDFEIVEQALPALKDGEMLCRTIYLSLDPYMRGRISGVKSYAKGVDPGELMVGGTVSEVLESKHPAFKTGDIVQGYDGWQATPCRQAWVCGRSIRRSRRRRWRSACWACPG